MPQTIYQNIVCTLDTFNFYYLWNALLKNASMRKGTDLANLQSQFIAAGVKEIQFVKSLAFKATKKL